MKRALLALLVGLMLLAAPAGAIVQIEGANDQHLYVFTETEMTSLEAGIQTMAKRLQELEKKEAGKKPAPGMLCT